MDVSALDLVPLVAAAGGSQISVFTHSPRFALPGRKFDGTFPLVTAETKREMLARLNGEGVRIVSVEFFPINPDIELAEYVPGLALARELGAARAVTHIHDTNSARAVERLGALCDIAAKEDITLGLEFMGLIPGGADSLTRAAWFIDQVGRKNIGIGLDALHLVRTGGTAAQVAALAPSYFAYAQICDGHGAHQSTDYIPDSLEREVPGDGDYPLADIFNALPAATPLEIEIPSVKRVEAGTSAGAHIAKIHGAVRTFVDGLKPTR
jgi:sugar phosphate isomerase/epimerase